MRRLVIAANWKMHGSQAMVAQWFESLLREVAIAQAGKYEKSDNHLEVVVCPPFPYLSLAKMLTQGVVYIGAQDCSDEPKGALTGQVAANMLKDCGCEYVIIGHSERRALNHESDALIAKKVLRALEGKLIPIVCVGETLQERQEEKTEHVIAKQLGVIVDSLTHEQMQNVIIAYEPVWAIGTGLAATAEQAQQVHAFLRKQIAKRNKKQSEEIRIIYGGSVKPDNAHELLSMPDIDGALVGGASLDAKSFAQIVGW